jgi:hypothetical protein
MRILIWKKEVVTLKRMQSLISHVMLAIWLVEAMSHTVAATPAVQRERVHIRLHLNCEKKKRGTGMGAVLVARMDKLVETVSMPRGITTPCRDKKRL